jgi:hypothetical protein
MTTGHLHAWRQGSPLAQVRRDAALARIAVDVRRSGRDLGRGHSRRPAVGRGRDASLGVVVSLAVVRETVVAQRVKRLLAGQLGKVLTTDLKDREDWRAALRETLEHDLTRADVVSHLVVAAEIIKTHLVRPGAFHAWNGRAVVLRADDDPTQGRRDRPRYERLFERHVKTIGMGKAGHAAALFDPPQYVHWLQQAWPDRDGGLRSTVRSSSPYLGWH